MNHYVCIDAYVFPDDLENWLPCPICKLRPKVWIFNNGRKTACGCGNSKYDHFSVRAESIISYAKRHNGSTKDYSCDELLKKWNHYCETGENSPLPKGQH